VIKTMRTGYAVLGALVAAAVVVLLVTLIFQLEVWMALVLLAVIDLVIIVAGYTVAKRAALADKRDGS
jgi:membrane protein implicated in regulation of membrane protease activity